MTDPPRMRVHPLNEAPRLESGAFVLYWMVANRRLGWNFALDRALDHARSLERPLVILEALRSDYPWASVRHHRFVLEGMREHARALEGSPVTYHPYVEPAPGEGKGLLEALAKDACVVVTDLYPAFFLPRMQRAVARRLDVRLEAVDSCGLLPLAAADRTFSAAFHFRRFLQKTLPDHLLEMPSPNPLADHDLPVAADLPSSVCSRWPAAGPDLLDNLDAGLAAMPLDASVGSVPMRGGTSAGRARLQAFLEGKLERYAEERNDPDADAQSGLSPWLHWGHLSAHEVFRSLAQHEGWSPARLSSKVDGRRQGWWGMSAAAEAFVDELVTWREIGFNYCWLEPAYDQYETLPEWARATLEAHASDPREVVYSLEEFEAAATHDELWNAAQRQLVGEGVIHNYLRMLWGKKILEWSASPRDALAIMLELNNRYAIDGRDPNSYTGIFWVLGRFDRGWPERPVYGKVRSMSSDSTRRKVNLDRYLERWGAQTDLGIS